MIRVKVLRLNGFKEEYECESIGFTAIGDICMTNINPKKNILIHPCQIRKIETEEVNNNV